jgi:3-hydroxyacyl-CoA dehydrogenase/enoyl-CoA hydratase/3-hydroxybutyryl-CoA epimerase
LRKKKPNREAVQLWQSSQGEPARQVPVLSQADMSRWIQQRLVTLTVLEALRCLDEGMVADVDDLDCAMCLSGWASHRGGPLGYAQQLGIDALAAQCDQLANAHGKRYAFPKTSVSIFAN